MPDVTVSKTNYKELIAFIIIMILFGMVIFIINYNARFIMVSFENQYDSNMPPIEHNKFKHLFMDNLDDFEDYVFQGWYTDSKFENQFINGSKPKKSFTLYAKWEPRYHDNVCVYGYNENEEEFYIKAIKETYIASIPEEYGGLPITKLYSSAIHNNLIRINFSDNLQTLIIDDFSFITSSKIRLISIGKGYKGVDLSLLSNSGAQEENFLSVLLNLQENVLAGIIFSFLPSLKNIAVSDEHPFLRSYDDVLFLKQEASLVCYPSARTSVTYEIPEGTEIFYTYFSSNEYLTTLKLPESFISFESNRFDGFPNIADIDIPLNNSYYTYIDQVLYSKDMKILYYYSSHKTDKIFVIPEGVESCESNSFSTNIYLEELIIPSNVENLNTQKFNNFESLHSIMVNENNPNYCSLDGVLFSKTLDTLYFYPIGKTSNSYEIPTSVNNIKANAFINCKHLKNVYISNNVTIIEQLAFNTMNLSLFCQALIKPSLWDDNWINHNYRIFVYWGWE